MEILVLIARIILIIAGGVNAFDAVARISSESGVDFSILWDNLPSEWK